MNNDDDDERSIAFYVIERLILLDIMLAACMEDLLHEGLIQVYTKRERTNVCV